MSMKDFIDRMYEQRAGQPEGTQKLANAEMFAKLAAQNNIDLSQFSPEQTMQLYNNVFNKTAAPQTQQQAPDVTKLAQAEFDARREEQEKRASAESMGRIMARALVDELQVMQKEGQMPPQFMKKKEGEGDEDKKPEGKKDDHDGDEKEKKAAAFELLSIEHAVKEAHAAGYDPEAVRKHVEAVHTLNLLGDSEKVASVCRMPQATMESAVTVRGLEYLEKIGMKIEWEKVLPKA